MHLVGAFLAKPQLAAVAQRQHGMVSTAQLNEAGLARRAIASAVKHG
jgi:putative AbiEi antitoxin of type IV toxin-antitoxin system